MGTRVAAEIRARQEPYEPQEPYRAAMADLSVRSAGIASGTDDRAGPARIAEPPAELFSSFGPIARPPIGPGGADHLVLSVDGPAPAAADRAPRRAMLGTCETVWRNGFIECSSSRVDSAGIGTGQGYFDTKGALLPPYYARAKPRRPCHRRLNGHDRDGRRVVGRGRRGGPPRSPRACRPRPPSDQTAAGARTVTTSTC
jgi:hypothetical protein